ncbi:hypothetical protein FACS1894170_07220 [Planctomycetales bacterium]|nr:hypothetical protein FACS1894170_07220 [Planctomycetales bacterium]
MSTQPIPMTFEQLMQSFQESRQEMKERAEQYERERKEADERAERRAEEAERRAEERAAQYEKERKEAEKAWNKRFGEFSDRLGELVEGMVEGKIVRKFQQYNYTFGECSQRHKFDNKKINVSGEFDLFLQDGDYVLGIEVKLKLTISDVKDHIERLQKYRQYLDAKDDKRKILAAVAGGVIPQNVLAFAVKNGLFAITQSGEAFDIVPPPKGFKPKEW